MPTISLTMMVRDAARTLRRAVASARPVVDEVCIIDTGSRDGTARLARQLADRFESRRWPDSFAVARNWTLDFATGDYALVLDADEYIARPKKTARFLRAALSNHRKMAALDLTIENHMRAADGSVGVVEHFGDQPRLLLRHAAMRYEGAAHHQIHPAIERLKTLGGLHMRCDEVIIHTGYDLGERERRAKFEQRLPLYRTALREARTAQDRNYYRYKLGAGYYTAGLPKKALEALAQVEERRLRPEQKTDLRSLVAKAYLYQAVHGDAVSPEQAAQAAARLVEQESNPETLLTAGSLLRAVGRPREALRCLLMAYERSGGGHRRDVSRAVVAGELASAAEEMGNPDVAADLRGGGAGRVIAELKRLLESQYA